MKGPDRKAAVAAYKEQKVFAGIFALTCAPTGEVWVGGAPNISTIQNRVNFDLSLGKHRNKALQEAWNKHGAESVVFEVKEKFEAEDLAYVQASKLKERLEHWQTELKAKAI
jgi:hypothetical protein